MAGVTMGGVRCSWGIAWRIMGGRHPWRCWSTTGRHGASTFVRLRDGEHPWVHLALLGLWAAMSGLLVAIGNRGGVWSDPGPDGGGDLRALQRAGAGGAGLAGLVVRPAAPPRSCPWPRSLASSLRIQQ